MAEPSRAVSKQAKEDYLQKYLRIFIFLSDLSLLNVKSLAGYG